MTDLDILTEGRARLRASASWLTDAMFESWANSSRQYGATFALTLEGVVARYSRESAPPSHQSSAMNQSE